MRLRHRGTLLVGLLVVGVLVLPLMPSAVILSSGCGCLALDLAGPFSYDCEGTSCMRAYVSNQTRPGLRLSGAKLTMSQFRDLDLSGADLSRVKCAYAGVTRVRLVSADCTGAEFNCTMFDGCDMAGANLRLADFANARFIACNLADADLTGARFTGCSYDRDTVWPKNFIPTAHGAVLTGNSEHARVDDSPSIK